MLIPDLIASSANKYSERTALMAGVTGVTYRQLADESLSLAGKLARIGLLPGDRLAILLPNSIDLAVLFIAASHARLVIVPLPPYYSRLQNGHILLDSQPSALIVAADLLDHVPVEALSAIPYVVVVADGSLQDAIVRAGPAASAEVPCRRGEGGSDPLFILAYTSGTTGYPKGVAQSQGRLVERSGIFVRELSLAADDSTIACFNIGRPMILVCSFLAVLGVGGAVSLLERFDGELFWQSYERAPPSYCVLRPGSLKEVIRQPRAIASDHSRLRFWISGGDAPTVELYREVLATSGRPLLNMFGTTEVGFLTINPPEGPVKAGSIGFPMETAEMKLVDSEGQEVAAGHPGTLLARTSHMMLGYWNRAIQAPEPMTEAWFDTRDLARVDEDGCYWFIGRSADLILRDGFKVASTIVVEGLTAHTAIAEALVVGIRDSRVGQLPVAFYRLAPDAEQPTQEALRAWIAAWVDAASVPVWFHRIDEWPLTAEGKIDRRQLSRLAEAGAQSYGETIPVGG